MRLKVKKEKVKERKGRNGRQRAGRERGVGRTKCCEMKKDRKGKKKR